MIISFTSREIRYIRDISGASKCVLDEDNSAAGQLGGAIFFVRVDITSLYKFAFIRLLLEQFYISFLTRFSTEIHIVNLLVVSCKSNSESAVLVLLFQLTPNTEPGSPLCSNF